VKLQRRLPGTTDWTTVATMTPGTASGTYAAGYQLRADMEFRATFASPSSEGLNGDSSQVVTVRVGACTRACPQSIQR
jgi:hypothetical protein